MLESDLPGGLILVHILQQDNNGLFTCLISSCIDPLGLDWTNSIANQLITLFQKEGLSLSLLCQNAASVARLLEDYREWNRLLPSCGLR